MATGATGGHGAGLFVNTVGTTWVKVAEGKDLQAPAIEQDVQEATNQDSGGAVERVAVGVQDGGEITVQTNLLQSDATQAAMIGYASSGTLKPFRIVYPSGTKRVSFSAIVKRAQPTFPVRGIAMLDMTLAVSGAVVIEAHP